MILASYMANISKQVVLPSSSELGQPNNRPRSKDVFCTARDDTASVEVSVQIPANVGILLVNYARHSTRAY